MLTSYRFLNFELLATLKNQTASAICGIENSFANDGVVSQIKAMQTLTVVPK